MNGNIRYGLKGGAGFSYVETLLAVALLAVCIAPLLQTYSGASGQLTLLSEAGRKSSCLREVLERVMAEPYSALLASATSKHNAGIFSLPTGYSLAPDARCPSQRNIFILRYEPGLVDPFSSTSNDMLYVRGEQLETAAKATLVINE